MKLSLLAPALAARVVAGQVAAWGQCGGISYTGATTCAAGYTCITVNDYYSQCKPGAAASTTLVTSASSSSSATPSSAPTASSTTIRYLGRVNPATKELSWPGEGITFTFTGTSAAIGLASVTGTNSVDLIVDDGAPTVISNVNGTSISTPKLAAGTHTVVLHKRSEALYGSVFLTGTVTTDGTVARTAPAPSARRIEFVGDSITVGYGLDGVNPCTNTAALEDNPLTYAALASDQLKADYSIIAWSGKGIVRNYADDGQALMPELWTRYGANDADNTYPFPSSAIPQAVVINLGTNDFGYLNTRAELNVTAYIAATVSFIKTVETKYPNATFFLMTSPMLSDTYPTDADAQHTTQKNALMSVVGQVGSGRAQVVDWPTQGADVGCDYHPDAATHSAEAGVLAGAIGKALGWS